MKWLIVLDPLKQLNHETDTSLALITTARRTGIIVDTGTINGLYFDKQPMVLANDENGESTRTNLDDYDLIMMRKEPPYDLPFHYATQLLATANVLVVNAPSALQGLNEKLIALPFVEHMPATIVTSDAKLIDEFLIKHGGGVLKDLDSFQGIGVTKIEKGEVDKVNTYTQGGKYPVMIQEFLEEVYEGDKRVLILGDRVLGAVMRRPISGFHANFANSEKILASLSAKEQRLVAQVVPWLLEKGIHFSGLDLIGEKLTEINITCPTGIMQLSELSGTNVALDMVEYFSKLVSGE